MTPYQRFIHLSRYARWIPSENRRETWEETVTRYFDFFRMKLERDNSFIMKDSEWGYLASAVKEMAAMPAMRCLMTAGEALDRDNTSGYNCSALLVDRPSSFDAAAFILLCGTGVGFSVERQFINRLPTIPNSLIKTASTIRVEDSKEGWAYAIKELITMLYAGRIPTWDLSQVRPSGARLRTFGGRASGPEPLDRLLHSIVRIFTTAKGRKLRSIECHDLMCHIGESVVVGGVRRCLPSGSMVHTKDGMVPIEKVEIGAEVLTTEGYHKVTNKFDQGEQELVTVVTQDSFFRCTPNHRIAVLSAVDSYIWKNAEDLEPGDRIIAPSFGVEGSSVAFPEYSYFRRHSDHTSKKIILPELDEDMAWLLGLLQGDGYIRVTDSSGEINLPYNHADSKIGEKAKSQLERFGVHVGITSYENYSVLRVKSVRLARYLHSWLKQPKTTIRTPEFMFKAPRSIKLAYISGVMDADGSCKTRPIQVAMSVYWDFIKDLYLLLTSCGIQSRIKSLTIPDDMLGIWQDKYALVLINRKSKEVFLEQIPTLFKNSISLGLIDQNTNSFPGWMVKDRSNHINKSWSSTDARLIPVTVVKVVEDPNDVAPTWDLEVETKHEFFCEGYLMHNSATISLSNLSDERMRAAKSGSWWTTDPQRALANNTVAYTERPDMSQFFEEWMALFQSKSGERGIFNRYGTIQEIITKGRRNPVRPDGGYFDYLTNPCGEIILRPDQFCNLSEVVARDSDSKADFLEKARLASILGTMQSTLDSFGYLKDVGQWTANVKEERLLGVSITGILDSPLLIEDTGAILREGKELVIGTNKEWAAKLGINPSVATTCIKPSGTVSQLVDASSGIHPRWSPYYIRRVRSDIKDPLTIYMRDQGFPHEQDQFNPQNIIFSFPINSPKSGSVFRGSMTAVDQLELWKKVKDNFCEHNPSTTIYVRDEEWMEVGAWVYKRLDNIGGLSFLPYSDHIYQQAPYEECSKEQHDHLAAQIPNVDFSAYTELDDHTVGSQEYACVGGACEVV